MDFIERFLLACHHLPPEFLWIAQVLIYFMIILTLLRFMGRQGLYLYIIVAVIAANIQSLKIVQFSFLSHPVAIGTELFASIYLATDILVEYYDRKSAQKAILLGLLGYFFFTFFVMLALSYPPLRPSSTIHSSLSWALENHDLMTKFFMPVPSLFLAGILAYVVSQFQEIYVFSWLSKVTAKRFLWLRNLVAGITASFLDTVLFSLLAWQVFAPHPIDSKVLWSSYILGSFILRICVSFLDTPFLYAARSFLPPNHLLNKQA
jgi:queuosine precursor transporter